MDEQAVKKPKLVVAGVSGFIGTAVCKELVKHYDVVVLTRSRARSQMANPSIPITWLYCDLFSKHDVENALAGSEYVVYLVHVRMPTARLDQSHSDDINLLLADNFARAAHINNVKQIVFFGGMISEENISYKILESDNEVLRTLSSYNVPVTSVRAGIVAGPGGIFIRLLANMTLRFPIVFVPRWALKPRQPISVKDVARAINYCIGNPETFGKQFDIGGPDIMPFDEMMKMTASSLSKKRIIITTNFFTPRLYALWIRLGFMYLPLLMSYFILLRLLPDGVLWVFFTLTVAFSGDVFAFYIGKTIGKRKLQPFISPGKTVAGTAGLIIGSVAGGILFQKFAFTHLPLAHAVILGSFGGIMGQLGDLFESAIKRAGDAKDAGFIFPGHGGILDRLDSLTFITPFVFYYQHFVMK